MFIKINIQSYQELELVTVLLLNRIIKENKSRTILDDVGVAGVLYSLKSNLIQEELLGNVGSPTSLDYSKDDIVECARELLELQRERCF